MNYIAKSGHKYIMFFGVLMLLAFGFDMFKLFFVAVFIVSLLFFRGKISKPLLSDPLAIISPIDGKILEIGSSDFDGKKCTRVVIQKSVCGVGLLYSPCEAKITEFRQRHGLFLCLKLKQALSLNEKAIYYFSKDGHKIAMRVIAGPLSRELSLENPQSVNLGDELGFLGSGQVMLFLPNDAKICVGVGENLLSLSTLGYLNKKR
ncbi:phosphatidylserine decarboxylase [Campylobacter mucosalis]|uniref:Phosphatidylserine decarboxylase-related protein n=1 Tax=Campylobacter mucosalis CCUG 21559 TaxID=1032067 RepID=A0A6G5QFV1_9BACT|nr:phosphatidylserine decarboxylase [Campylobacter mucosalis]QCD44531.1 phosphatidylserine decarboxylase-related protein [Campylobacter mucosalis CCUG 21559]